MDEPGNWPRRIPLRDLVLLAWVAASGVYFYTHFTRVFLREYGERVLALLESVLALFN